MMIEYGEVTALTTRGNVNRCTGRLNNTYDAWPCLPLSRYGTHQRGLLYMGSFPLVLLGFVSEVASLLTERFTKSSHKLTQKKNFYQ